MPIITFDANWKHMRWKKKNGAPFDLTGNKAGESFPQWLPSFDLCSQHFSYYRLELERQSKNAAGNHQNRRKKLQSCVQAHALPTVPGPFHPVKSDNSAWMASPATWSKVFETFLVEVEAPALSQREDCKGGWLMPQILLSASDLFQPLFYRKCHGIGL